MKDHTFKLRRKIWRLVWLSQLQTQLTLTSSVLTLKPEKKIRLNGIQSHDLCDIAAVLYQLSFVADLVVSSLYTRRWWRMQVNHERSYIWTAEKKYEDMIDHCSYVHNLRSCEIKAWKKNSSLNGCEPITSALLMQSDSTNWVIKPNGNWSCAEGCKWTIYERSYVWSADKDMQTSSQSVIYTT